MRNILLFGLLITLLIFTYLLDNNYLTHSNSNSINHMVTFNQILDLDSILEIHTPKIILKRNQGVFYTLNDQLPVDQESLIFFLNYLKKIRTIRPLAKDDTKKIIFPKNKLSITFKLNDKTIEYSIGEVLQFEEGFYLQINDSGKKEVIIVQNSDHFEGLYRDTKDLAFQKYNHFKKILKLNPDFFLDKKVFSKNIVTSIVPANFSDQKIDTIFIESGINRPFQLSFNPLKTSPAIPDGLEYDHVFFRSFIDQLLNIKAEHLKTSLTKKDISQLDNHFSKITIILKNKKKLQLDVYKNHKNENGYFIHTNFNKYDILYILNKKQARPLFANIQDFWQKQVFSNKNHFGKKAEKFILTFDSDEIFHLTIPVENKFMVEIDDQSIKNKRYVPKQKFFQNLFMLLMGVETPKAQRLSHLSKNFQKMEKDKEGFNLKFEDFTIRLTRSNGETMISNFKYGYRLHYFLDDQFLTGVKINDFFYIQKAD